MNDRAFQAAFEAGELLRSSHGKVRRGRLLSPGGVEPPATGALARRVFVLPDR